MLPWFVIDYRGQYHRWYFGFWLYSLGECWSCSLSFRTLQKSQIWGCPPHGSVSGHAELETEMEYVAEALSSERRSEETFLKLWILPWSSGHIGQEMRVQHHGEENPLNSSVHGFPTPPSTFQCVDERGHLLTRQAQGSPVWQPCKLRNLK